MFCFVLGGGEGVVVTVAFVNPLFFFLAVPHAEKGGGGEGEGTIIQRQKLSKNTGHHFFFFFANMSRCSVVHRWVAT